MLKISANDAQLTVVACGPITSDRIDLPCEITLSPEFDGLAVTVVFKAGDVQRDVAMLGSPVHVPAECLEQAGEVLMVGIWAGDGSGRPTIPTVWASAGTIRTGALPSGYDPEEPEPDWAAQVQQAAAQAVATANSVREDADAGVFDGVDGYSPSATVTQGDGSATITITDKDGTTTATVHDGADGQDGRDGTDGVDGFSPTATVTQTATGATVSITDQSGTTTASVSNGTDGTDGSDGFSPTVDVQPITGGHEVTITDADGAHSFDVLDGDPAEPGSITDAMLAPDGIKAQVKSMWGNRLTGELTGNPVTASDAYAAPPMALTVNGASTQAGTPTPDAPVPILSVDDLSLTVTGKNLYEGTDLTFTQRSTINLTNNLVAGTYTASAEVTSDDTDSTTCLVVFWYVGGGSAVSQVARGARASVTLTPTKPVFQVTFYASNSAAHGSGDTATWKNIQIEAGTTATAYTPYVEPTTVPDLLPEGTSLRSLPDGTKDELALTYLRPSTRAGWAWYERSLAQRVWHVNDVSTLVLSGFNANNKFATYSLPYTGVNTANNHDNVLCTEYVCWHTLVKPCCYVTSNGSIILFGNDDFADRATAEAMLSGVSFDYQLATPITTTLDPIELPELPAPTCTVFCDGGSAQPTYQIQYVQDTNLVIAELRAALADLATS